MDKKSQRGRKYLKRQTTNKRCPRNLNEDDCQPLVGENGVERTKPRCSGKKLSSGTEGAVLGGGCKKIAG